MGSESEPLNHQDKLSYTQKTQQKIYRYIEQYLCSSITSTTRERFNFLDEIHKIKTWWLNDFDSQNEDPSPLPCTLNDALCHIYIQLIYIQHHRQISLHLEFERQQKNIQRQNSNPVYDFTLVIHACCALAELAGYNHIHVMQDPQLQLLSKSKLQQQQTKTTRKRTLQDLDREEQERKDQERQRQRQHNQRRITSSPLDHRVRESYPSIDALDQFLQQHHLGYLNLWYYYRQYVKDKKKNNNEDNDDDDNDQHLQWEIVHACQQYVQQKRQEWKAKVDGERHRLLALSGNSTSSSVYTATELIQNITDTPPPLEWIPPTSESWFKVRSLHTYVMIQEDADLQQGCFLWKRDPPEDYMERMIPFQSHILAHIYKEHDLMNSYPISPISALGWSESGYVHCRGQFQTWFRNLFHDLIRRDHESFVSYFIAITFDHLLPLGSRTYWNRKATHRLTSDMLFMKMLGHPATVYVSGLLNSHEYRSHIALTPTHVFYPYLVLALFHFDFMQQGQVISNFYEEYVVKSSDLAMDDKAKTRFEQIKVHHQSRLPLLSIIRGAYCIHHTTNEKGTWYICQDVVEWMITWFDLTQQILQSPPHHNNTRLPSGRSLKHWIQALQLNQLRLVSPSSS